MEMSNVNNCYSFNVHPLNLSSTAVRSNHNPRKKRTKFLRIITSDGCHTPKPKTTRRPNPSAPKITMPCTECGKKFWSWKALFGHMRCHPERQWRGINPPPNFRQQPEKEGCVMTEEDREVAACLLILANGPKKLQFDQGIWPECSNPGRDVNQGMPEYSESGRGEEAGLGRRFECLSFKKVFGSHQALGGYGASQKNVKGCCANTRKAEEEEGCCSMGTEMSLGHKCSVCLRVFSSGQALGGHKRCHWEMSSASGLGPRVCGLNLNLNFPADPRVEDDYDYDSLSLGPLDLGLGL